MSNYSDEVRDDESTVTVAAEDSQSKSRDYVFTWNKYPQLTDEQFLVRFRNYFGENLRFVAWSHEVGKCGTPHLQGFVYFRNARVMGRPLKTRPGEYTKGSLKAFAPEVHWEPMYGNLCQNVDYCSKWGTQELFFWGEPPAQGARSDLAELTQDVMSGEFSMRELCMRHPTAMVKYHRGVSFLLEFISEHRDERPSVVWLVGEPGSGKSSYASNKHGAENVYRKSDGSKFFEGYHGQEACVIEEFVLRTVDPDGWSFRKLLQLIDRYGHIVEVKGSHVKFDSPYVYITSVEHPSDIFKSEIELVQVLRRLDGIYTISKGGKLERDERYASMYFDPDRPEVEHDDSDHLASVIERRAARREEELKKRRESRSQLMLTARRQLGMVRPQPKGHVVSPVAIAYEDEA